MYQETNQLGAIGDSFFNLLKTLEADQVEYDLGCEDVMANHGSVKGQKLIVGQRIYSVVVLPSALENLNGPTAKLLKQYVEAGGIVCRVQAGESVAVPTYVDGKLSDELKPLENRPTWKTVTQDQISEVSRKTITINHFAIHRAEADAGILFHHRRQVKDGELVFLVNTSDRACSVGTLESGMKGVEQWDLHTGESKPYAFERTIGGVKAAFTLQPCESSLLFLSKKAIPSKLNNEEKPVSVAASGPVTVTRTHANVLTLDYVDITAGEETLENQYFYQANQFVFRKNGLDRNPWDSAVQYKDELITRTFASR